MAVEGHPEPGTTASGSVDAAGLARRVAAHHARVDADYWAATALILTDTVSTGTVSTDTISTGTVSTGTALTETSEGPAVLLIRRVSRDGDRWSGDMALPGGKRELGDHDAAHTAARETFEETGVTVGPPVGRLDDLVGRPATHRIATVVFTVDGRPEPVPEPAEVAAALWLPVAALADPANRTWHRYGGVVPFPSITVGETMIWGLTHRILTHFMAVAGLT